MIGIDTKNWVLAFLISTFLSDNNSYLVCKFCNPVPKLSLLGLFSLLFFTDNQFSSIVIRVSIFFKPAYTLLILIIVLDNSYIND